MTSSEHRIDARDWSLLAVLSVLWGGSFFFNGVVLRELPPLTVVLLRVAVAALILLPVLWAYRIRLPRGISGWKPFFAIALLNNVLPFSLIVTGQTYVSSGLASVLNATTPLFTVLVMAAAGDEKLRASRVAGVIIGLTPRANGPSVPTLAKLDPAQQRGRDFAVRRCAGCHTVGLDDGGASDGPAFRRLATRYNPISLERRFAEVSAHGFDRMPPVEFTRSELEDLVAYIDSLRGA